MYNLVVADQKGLMRKAACGCTAYLVKEPVLHAIVITHSNNHRYSQLSDSGHYNDESFWFDAMKSSSSLVSSSLSGELRNCDADIANMPDNEVYTVGKTFQECFESPFCSKCGDEQHHRIDMY